MSYCFTPEQFANAIRKLNESPWFSEDDECLIHPDSVGKQYALCVAHAHWVDAR